MLSTAALNSSNKPSISLRSFAKTATRPWLFIASVALTLIGADYQQSAASTPPSLTLSRPEDQSKFRVTTFASGLSFPTSMTTLADGSLLVASNTGTSLFTSTGTLIRLVDLDNDGITDGEPITLASNLPGVVTSLRRAGDLIVALSAEGGNETISLFRTGASATEQLKPAGKIHFSFPDNFEHTTYALAVRPSASEPSATEVYFNIGAKTNASSTPNSETVGIAGDGTNIIMPLTQLVADSVHRITLRAGQLATQLEASTQLIATGLRNAAGMIFGAEGDLYIQDNGIDTPENRNISLSADELNRIQASDIGSTVPDFGFASTYISAETGATISNGAVACADICPVPGVTEPLVAFRPINGERSEGAVELALAPKGFGTDFDGGVFTSFFGMWTGGTANEENPVVFANPATGDYFHFIPNQLLGHPNGLLSTEDSLYVSDLDYGGYLNGPTNGTIYQIKGQEIRNAPGPLPILGLISAAAWSRKLRRRILQAEGNSKLRRHKPKEHV